MKSLRMLVNGVYVTATSVFFGVMLVATIVSNYELAFYSLVAVIWCVLALCAGMEE
jgi:hypothetical protein